MRVPPTLSRYVARQFAFAFVSVFLVLVGVAFIVDLIELLRRSGSRPEATFWTLLQLASLKLPFLAQEILTFAMLFGSILAFWRLTRSHELLVARAAGVSAWQFLAPAVLVATLTGVVMITIFNPIASALRARHDALENQALKGRISELTLSRAGLWLRQPDGDGQAILHAARVGSEDGRFRDVTVFRFRDGDRLIQRLDAPAAQLEDGRWRMIDAWSWRPEQSSVRVGETVLSTSLTARSLQESFASPQTISFWELPNFIQLIEQSGFSAHRHRIYWHSLLARPFLLGAMVLIAATFALRPARRGGTTWLIACGVFVGFLLYFVSDVVLALGLSASIPVALAAWAPTGVSLLVGATILLHAEDG